MSDARPKLTPDQEDNKKHMAKTMGEFMTSATHIGAHIIALHVRISELENRLDETLRRLAGEDNT